MQLNMEMPGRRSRTDHVLIASIMILAALGLITLFSASDAYSRRLAEMDRAAGLGLEERNSTLFEDQLVHFFVGALCCVAASLLPVRMIRSLVPFAVALAAIFCILTFVPGIGDARNGAARWIRVGSFNYQPSELVKLALPLYLAHIFDKKRGELDSFVRGILPPALILTLFFLLIYAQNNFSTALFITLNGLLIFYMAGVKFRYFLGAGVILIPLSVVFVLTREHRLIRLISYLWPDQDPLGADYQVKASLISVASGGLWGKGLGRGTRKISSVPEVHSDFIFSSYTEELGFAGVLLFFTMFLVFAYRGYRAALRCADPFRRLLGISLVTIIVSQALINIAVVAGALPVTGMPLPFFSHGGSSLVTTLSMAGLIVNISRNTAPPAPGEEALHV
ncbi:MAG: putative lipid II flippase FtsW [Spirochaetaceae bacterium]|jgi:cell division protein FtsW|nr:putative lipid II flippase FtsW [Spirochaetaceae bacterium]